MRLTHAQDDAPKTCTPGRRIVIIGTTGAGKTTLAQQLAARLTIPHIEIDALYWGPQWTAVPREVFRERVTAATATTAWVADGNYKAVRDILWARADTLIWLDYPLAVNLWRLARRSVVRRLSGIELWSGNRESLRKQFLSRDSLLVWALRSHRRHRREFRAAVVQPAYAHLTVIQLDTPRATDCWLAGLES